MNNSYAKFILLTNVLGIRCTVIGNSVTGMLPLWMFLLGKEFLVEYPESAIEIPYKNILISLSCLIVPLFIGVLIRRCLPKCAEMAGKVIYLLEFPRIDHARGMKVCSN